MSTMQHMYLVALNVKNRRGSRVPGSKLIELHYGTWPLPNPEDFCVFTGEKHHKDRFERSPDVNRTVNPCLDD